MKRIILLLFCSLFLFGCVQTEMTCNKPYILVGDSCCLDKNNNQICDKDDGKVIVSQEVEVTESKSSCTISAGIGCTHSSVTSDSAVFVLQNRVGKEIRLDELSVGINCKKIFGTDEGAFPDGSTKTVTITDCINRDINGMYNINVKYIDDETGVSYSKSGEVFV